MEWKTTGARISPTWLPSLDQDGQRLESCWIGTALDRDRAG
jgi:uncharacterized protein (TIGR02118 family)